ncbi:hypothetical protein TRFO_14330 [Tritrichomonas foetus]|uniref:Protein kinase domain-containing protein n=1 Tax=Tritrichomonas foetus TaxID=1144522 RepID=A0A1J4KW93_9EUKA|nr:hypothetical protein TRFO_14330 [Tritrichomonas foetus]|eukprot:OHT15160.1 hypothetical protein TRFO_14330 [Tritrichomonas foetus]
MVNTNCLTLGKMPPKIYTYDKLSDLKDFEISDTVIGEGSFGRVREALRRAKGKNPEMKVAIKEIKSGCLQTSHDQANFHRELCVQISLKHLCILPIVGYTVPFMGQGKYSIITPLMAKGSLKHVIKDLSRGIAPDGWDDTKRSIIIFGIACGMAYIHQSDVIHRDLKCDNVLLDENFYPKICDFGLSKVFKEGTENMIKMTRNTGTPLYMAPEIYDNEAYSNKVDVFAFAMLLFEFLTLDEPWKERGKPTLFKLVAYLTQGLRPNLAGVSDSFKELIERCWDQDPHARPPFKEIVELLITKRKEFFDDPSIDEEELLDFMETAITNLKLDVKLE